MYNTISQYDYDRIEYREGSNHDSFKIKTGKWSGTVITYGQIAMTEPLDGGPPTLKFQYQIEETPLNPDELSADNEFNNYIGDMLSHIIEKALEENNFTIGDNPNGTESTNNNSEESSK